jgi:hypothetical protein
MCHVVVCTAGAPWLDADYQDLVLDVLVDNKEQFVIFFHQILRNLISMGDLTRYKI